ncbi:hypothetical protein [Microbacterium sp. NPDC055357]
MDAHAAAEELLSIIERHIEQMGYARYNGVRDELAREAGEEWIVLSKRHRRNISPDVTAAFRKLDGWASLDWNAPRQRWTRKPTD